MATSSAADRDKPEQILEIDDDYASESENFLQSTSAPAVSFTSPANMGSDDGKREKHQKHGSHTKKIEENGELWQHLTTAAHACVLLFVILIIYFCFSGKFEFFTWHPLLMSVGWMFLMTEAILAISKDNLFTGTLPKWVRVRLHWIFQAVAITLIVIGFLVVYINKNNLNKEHFKSWHGLLGFIGIVSTIPTTLNGVLALYHGALRFYIRVKINKFIHIASGIITFGFGGMALILSVYTKWFARQSNDNAIVFVLGLGFAVTAVVWTLVRPAITCSNHLKQL